MISLYLEKYDCFIRYFVRNGEGLPIVFIPGLITPAVPLFFDMINQPLLKQRPVILINYPGTGISDSININLFDHHPKTHAEIIAKILKQETLIVNNPDNPKKLFHILGHSMGGTVAIYLAEEFNDQVASLIMCEANLFAGGGSGTRYITSFTTKEWISSIYPTILAEARIKGKDDATQANLAGIWQVSDPEATYYAAKQLVELDHDCFEKLVKLHVPRYFIYGEQNLPTSTEEAMPDTPLPKELNTQRINTRIISNSGHMMMYDNLNEFVTCVVEIVNHNE